MIYALIPTAAIIGLVLGFLMGRYQARLLDKIRTLELGPKEKPEAPQVTLGSYEQPKEISTTADTRPAGLVESKTPERIEWEARQALEKEARGY